MTWGINFTVDIFLSRTNINSKYELIDKIDELKEDIDRYKAQLKMLIAANPKDIIPDDWKEDPINFLNIKFDEIYEILEEDLLLLQRLQFYLDSNPEFNG